LVQTTLLGLGIAIILALLAALVGPLFVDWDQYRDVIETEAGRVVGVPVRVAGPIEVRLLPTPSVSLGDVKLAPVGADAAQSLTARRLAMDFGLGTLVRGEFRANQVTIEGLDLTIGLDRFGNVETAANLGFDPDRFAIDRLTIEGGRIALSDAASGGRLAIDDVNLKGEVRSLLGPFKAEGTFVAGGEHFGYRLSGSRRSDDGSMRLRLALDPTERALAFESEGKLWVEAGAPRYEGAATLTRVVGTALPGGQVAINDPWKIAGKLKVSSANALFDELDLQYGPDVRTVHLTGSAIVDFGRAPRAATVLTARQIDLDRVLGAAAPKRLPFEMVKSLAESLATFVPPQLPIRIGLGIDSLTVGGATLTAVRSDIASAPGGGGGGGGGWSIDTLDLRAPGATLTHVAGKLGMMDGKVEFKGPVKVDSSDPALFFAWIEGRSAAGRPALGPMRASGTITLGGERVAVDELAAEIDHKPLEGRLSYRFATPAMPARLDATLNAADLDIDRTLAVGNALFASTSFEPPGEIALALDIARATYAGVEARKAQAVLAFDRSGLRIERASIADLGGASIEASGRIDGFADAARGSVAISLAAPRLDGVTAVAEKFLPQAAEPMRKYGARMAPLRINAKLDVAPQPGKAAQAQSAAKLKLEGKIAGIGPNGIDLNLDASAVGDIAAPGAATLKLDGRLDAVEARTLAALVGLDALANADNRPARVTLSVNGAADRTFQIDGKFSGNASVAASAIGTLNSSGTGMLEATLRVADSQLPHRDSAVPVPVDVRARLAIYSSAVDLEDLYGKIAGGALRGQLTFGLGQPIMIDGRVTADQVDAGEMIALLTGTPRAAAAGAGAARAQPAAAEWPAEPFAQPAVPPLNGRVEFRVTTARWPAGLVARDLAGAVRFEPTGFSLNDVTGMLAGGRLSFDAQVRRESMGIGLHSHVKLVNADVPVLFAGALRVPATGRVSFETEVQGQGLSAASLVGALKGTGTLTAERLELAGLDPTALDAVIRAMDNDRGLGANPGRIAEIASAGLDVGRLRAASVTAPIVIADGRAQLAASASVQNTDIAGPVSLGLNDGQIDARLTMTGAARKNSSGSERPAIAVAIRGPLGAARRSIDVAPIINFVTMQRVEEESKRLDEAEKARQRLEAATEALRRQQDAAKTDSGSASPAPAQASTVGRAPDSAAGPDIKPAAPTPPPPPPRRTPTPPPQQRPPGLMDLFSPGR
jgi:hypothetical protein